MSMFDQQKQTAKRLQLRKRLLTINKRNVIQWNINRDNSFYSGRQALRLGKVSLKMLSLQAYKATEVTTYTRPQRVFSSVQTCGLVDLNQPLPRFHSLAKWRFFPRFSSTHGGRCRRLSRFYIILLQDLTPLHVKITRSANLLRFCRWKIKLPTYLHTVSYNHISFLNTRSQLFWVLASSGFYSITWRLLSRSAGYYKIHFREQPPVRGNFSLVSVISFVSLNSCYLAIICPRLSFFLYNPKNKQLENLYVNYKECFGYFTQLDETSLF